MLYQFKKFVNKREPEIILTMGIVLTALISFGIGRLSAPLTDNNSIIIETPPTASIQQSLNTTSQEEQKIVEGKLVGSINGGKYHWPDCSHAKRISPENQTWFSSETEAQSAGYTRCSNFEKYRPLAE